MQIRTPMSPLVKYSTHIVSNSEFVICIIYALTIVDVSTRNYLNIIFMLSLRNKIRQFYKKSIKQKQNICLASFLCEQLTTTNIYAA